MDVAAAAAYAATALLETASLPLLLHAPHAGYRVAVWPKAAKGRVLDALMAAGVKLQPLHADVTVTVVVVPGMAVPSIPAATVLEMDRSVRGGTAVLQPWYTEQIGTVCACAWLFVSVFL